MKRVGIERSIQISGVLVILGLLIELITFIWLHPTAFLSFLFLGGSLMAAGILYYLYSLIWKDNPMDNISQNNCQDERAYHLPQQSQLTRE